MKQFCLGVVIAAGLTLPAFGQQVVNTEEGIYVLNPAKSTFRGPGARTQAIKVGKETVTATGFFLNGEPFTATFPNADNTADGQSRPAPGAGGFDAVTSTRIDPYTVKAVRTKEGKVVAALTSIYNPDAKTLTVTAIGTAPNGQSFAHVWVFEKQ
jgi:hypothetical protein